MPVQVFFILACLLGSAFFSGAETAITAFGDARTRQRAEEGHASFRLWHTHPDRILAVILIGNTLVNIAASALASDLAFRAGLPHAVAVTTGVITFVVLVFGEITPKALAKRHAVLLAPLVMPVIALLYYALFPLAWFFSQFPRFVSRQAPAPPGSVTTEELEYLIGLGAREGVLDKVRGDLLSRVLAFSETLVKEVMTPRTQVVALELGASLEETMTLIAETDLSRIPVFEGTPDKVVGVLFVKDLVSEIKRALKPEAFALSRYMKPPFFVPELMKISRLLKEFQRKKTHIAIVVDEFGGTSGICTLEDVVEEIVGEIRDEYDTEEEKPLKVTGEGVILADAGIPIRDLEAYLEVDFPEEGGYETLGGFVTATAGKVPPTGSMVVWNGLRFTIKAADDRRVLKVEIVREPPRADQPPAGS